MDAKKFRLIEFISEKRTFVIPVYQRDYKWKITHCEQLFNDIVQIIENGKPHFIGTFVYQETAGADIFRELVIIDGQQRITSIILFVKVLYDLTYDTELKDDIYSTFIKHSRGELKGKCKLRPTEYDRDTFEKLMADDGFDENNFSGEEKKSAMYCNYRFFQNKISESKYAPKDFFNATGQLNIVSILLEEENPQEIFESLNSTGLDLSQADLIRNFLLMPLNDDLNLQEELYKNYWRKMEDLLRPSDNMENFIIQYLVAKLKSNDAYSSKVSPKTLYAVFKRYFHDKCSSSESCLKDMYRYAKFFRRFTFNDETKFANLSALDKKFYELVYLLEEKKSPIILMYLFDRYEKNHFDEATFIELVDALISIAFRAKVCKFRGIEQQYAGNVLARLEKEYKKESSLDLNIFWSTLVNTSKIAFPKDKDFQAALISNDLYTQIKSKFCKYMLYSLERAARDKELPPYSEATVEHVLPQTLNDKWKKYLAERNDLQAHELWLHNLGNLTLTGENPALGNSDFDTKKEIYLRSNFLYTRALAKCSDWTSNQIQARAKKLAAEALKVWTLPEEFNKALPNKNETHALDSDPNFFISKRPSTLSICGTEIKMPHWNHLLLEIAKKLYSLDQDVFRRAMQMENVSQRLFSTEPTNLKIADDLFINTNLDTPTCLKTAKKLTKNFDQLGDTNYEEDIWFTLKPQQEAT